jgi:hypothetical protein
LVNEGRHNVTLIEAEIATLALRYKDKHPKMSAAKASLADAKEKLRQAVLAQPAILRNAIEQLLIAAVAIAIVAAALVLPAIRASSWQSSKTQSSLQARSITYFIADGAGKPGYHSSDPELARWALDAWQRNAAKGIRFTVAAESNAIVRIYWAGPEGGEYGEMRPIMVGGQLVGAIGVSGVKSTEDGQIAKAGADSLGN